MTPLIKPILVLENRISIYQKVRGIFILCFVEKIDCVKCPNHNLLHAKEGLVRAQEVGLKLAEEQDRETTFSPTNSSKDHLNAEQPPQNNF